MPVYGSLATAARPPLSHDAAEQQRQEASALRRRLLYSLHRADVWQRVVDSVGPQRARAWLPLDMSSNPYFQTWERLSCLYRQERDTEGPHPDVIEAVEEAGVGGLMHRVQRDTLGLGEMLMLCDVDADGQPAGHLIYPDLASVTTDPRRPRQLLAVGWWEPDPRDATRWVRWHLARGVYTARDQNGVDVTRELREGETDYPWIGQTGEPLMPVVMYHRTLTGHTWDPYSYGEIVEGSLQLGLMYTHFSHLLRQAAWAQKWALGARAMGGTAAEDGSGASVVVADAATLLMLDAEEGATNPQVGQWTASANPEQYVNSIRIYERRLIEQAMGGVEVTRETSDIRSGYSLAVGREERQSLTASFAPQFRIGDRQAFQIWSDLLAVRRGVEYPTRWAPRRGAGTRKDPADIEYVIGMPTESAPGEQP